MFFATKDSSLVVVIGIQLVYMSLLLHVRPHSEKETEQIEIAGEFFILWVLYTLLYWNLNNNDQVGLFLTAQIFGLIFASMGYWLYTTILKARFVMKQRQATKNRKVLQAQYESFRRADSLLIKSRARELLTTVGSPQSIRNDMRNQSPIMSVRSSIMDSES